MRNLLFSVFIWLLPVCAMACSGKIDRVQLTRVGNVELISNDIYGDATAGRTVCNVSVVWKDVAPEACRGWYSLVLSSIALQSPVRIQYASGVSCKSMNIWANAPAPWMISNQN